MGCRLPADAATGKCGTFNFFQGRFHRRPQGSGCSVEPLSSNISAKRDNAPDRVVGDTLRSLVAGNHFDKARGRSIGRALRRRHRTGWAATVHRLDRALNVDRPSLRPIGLTLSPFDVA